MDPQRQDLKDYEMKRFHRMMDRLRMVYTKTEKYNFVKKYFFKRQIIKETQQHFSILNRLYNNDSKKYH